MAIRTDLTYEQALALPDPKYIWLNGSDVIVYTGADIPNHDGPRVISPYEFRQRFTEAEMDTVNGLAFAGDIAVRRLMLKLTTTEAVDLDSPTTIAGVQYLASQAAITAERAAEILA